MTDVLYGGDREHRIRQELLLGVGGVRALHALGVSPGVLHLNEGHSAFAPLEEAGWEELRREGFPDDRIVAAVRADEDAQYEAGLRPRSLDDYIGRMAEGQDTIWYITAESYAAAAGSPQLEAFKAKGIEALLMFDRIDEWMLGYLHEYDGKKLQNVAKGELPLDEADKQKQEEASKAAEPLVARLKELLGDRVSDVRVSARLTDSPSCLALSDFDMAPHFARLMKEGARGGPPDRAPIGGRPPTTARPTGEAGDGQGP